MIKPDKHFDLDHPDADSKANKIAQEVMESLIDRLDGSLDNAPDEGNILSYTQEEVEAIKHAKKERKAQTQIRG